MAWALEGGNVDALSHPALTVWWRPGGERGGGGEAGWLTVLNTSSCGHHSTSQLGRDASSRGGAAIGEVCPKGIGDHRGTHPGGCQQVTDLQIAQYLEQHFGGKVQ